MEVQADRDAALARVATLDTQILLMKRDAEFQALLADWRGLAAHRAEMPQKHPAGRGDRVTHSQQGRLHHGLARLRTATRTAR